MFSSQASQILNTIPENYGVKCIFCVSRILYYDSGTSQFSLFLVFFYPLIMFHFLHIYHLSSTLPPLCHSPHHPLLFSLLITPSSNLVSSVTILHLFYNFSTFLFTISSTSLQLSSSILYDINLLLQFYSSCLLCSTQFHGLFIVTVTEDTLLAGDGLQKIMINNINQINSILVSGLTWH